MVVIIAAWSFAVVLGLVSTYLALELIAGFPASGISGNQGELADQSVAILVPAHNEASGIGATLTALALVAPTARILVIADNCTDDTAAVARAAGAEVVERTDPIRRGKGFALHFGRERLAMNPPSAVIIIDADCLLTPGSAERLATRAIQSGQPVQAANLLTADPNAKPLVAISNFAMLVKNVVRARGLMRLSGGALLFGTGMAFPWPLFQRLRLATANAVEDLDLGLDLARQGVRVVLDDRACVMSASASLEDSRAQRSRWEHGFLGAALRNGLPLLARGVVQGSRHLCVLALHMLVPPLALFILTAVIALVTIAGLCLLANSWMPLIIASIAFGASLLLILIVWASKGRDVLPFGVLLRVPFYIMWKIPIYLAFFTRRQTGWNRTRREGEPL